MNLVELLGAELKSPIIVEVLELHDVDVVYDFDRLSEGQQDVYWASLRTDGLLLRFDQAQSLQTVFLYVHQAEGFSPCDLSKYDVDSFASVDEAESFAQKKGLRVTSRDLRPNGPHWIKIHFENHSAHYQFSNSGLSRITLTVAEVARD